MNGSYDVLVIGGGPAGACLAGMLARAGRRVLVVELREFPRHHIGESLLAMSIPLLREFGVLEKIAARGFVRKRGALFLWGGGDQPIDLPMPSPGYAFQVLRSEFDELMLEHARELGADILFRHRVVGLVSDGGRVTGLTVADFGGNTTTYSARFVVDASGLARFISRRLDLPLAEERIKRAAVSAYYSGAGRWQEPYGGDIVTEACRDGWLWFIPLSAELSSVGFVGDADDLRTPAEMALDCQIGSSKIIRCLLRPAVLECKPRLLRYTTYAADRPFWGSGYVLVGDAAFFVDPLFSTGVHAALYGAISAAAGIRSVLDGDVDEEAAGRWYDNRLRAHYRRVNATVRLLYGSHPHPNGFWRRRNLAQISDVEADGLLNDLGWEGARFFANSARNGSLELPAPIRVRLAGFESDLRLVAARLDDVLELDPGIEVIDGWAPKNGRLARSVILRDSGFGRPQIEFPRESFQADFIQALGGRLPVSETLARAVPDLGQRRKAILFAGLLVRSGLLRHAN